MGIRLQTGAWQAVLGTFLMSVVGYGADPDGSVRSGPWSLTYDTTRGSLLELTWNYGTEKDADFKYHNGNDQPQGFGHICITVDDLDAACARFEEKKVQWKKRLTDGRMKNIAFVLGMFLTILLLL